MPASDLSKLVARVLWTVGSHNNTFSDTVADDRMIQEDVRRALIETEAEVARALIEAYHPMRTQFLAWSSDLASGDTIPAHIGQVEAVRIEPYDGGSYVQGESTSRENIKLWRANTSSVFDALAHNVNGSALSGYYNITNQTIVFTGFAAQVKTGTYSPDYTTPALQIDNQFDNILVAGTIPRLNRIGIPQALIATYGQLYASQMQMIRMGLSEMPDLPEAQATQ